VEMSSIYGEPNSKLEIVPVIARVEQITDFRADGPLIQILAQTKGKIKSH